MKSVNDSLHQPHPINQKPDSSFKSLKLLALLITVLLIALGAGTGGYLLGIKTGQKSEIISQPLPIASTTPTTTPTPTPTVAPTTNNTTTVIIQGNYFFKVTIPQEYELKKWKGGYTVTDRRSNEDIIGFYNFINGGERSPIQGQTIIDGVPFSVMYTNRGAIRCPADLYATNAQFKLGYLFFEINTWCKDAHGEQDDIYERVIRSIQFSEDLRAVLLGKLPPPMLR